MIQNLLLFLLLKLIPIIPFLFSSPKVSFLPNIIKKIKNKHPCKYTLYTPEVNSTW